MSGPLVVFQNPGQIDPASITTFGVSVKEGENPIGYFGTGLKYAIAIYMRLGHELVIESGMDFYKFGTKKKEVRGKTFEIVTMNGEEMPFTTELGKNWESWQAFREIYCNCIDERGTVTIEKYVPKPEAGVTRIYLRGKEAFDDFHERDEIVLNVPEHLRLTTGEVEVYQRASRFLYYRGVRVLRFDNPAHLTYNIVHKQDLTEDRTLVNPGGAKGLLSHGISRIRNASVIRKVITSNREHFESSLDFDWLNYIVTPKLSPEFEQVLQEEYERNTDAMNRTARKYFQVLRDKRSLLNYQEEAMTPVEQQQLDKCLRILPDVFPDFKDYPIMVVKTLGETTMAVADADQGKMVVSKAAFRLGTKFLMSTLIEEYLHLKTGYGDQTRQLQTYLFDTIVTMIENHVLKEPV